MQPESNSPTSISAAEQARDLRARAWAYVFECATKKRTSGDGGDDLKEVEDDVEPQGSVLGPFTRRLE